MWNYLHLQCPAHDICEYPPESRQTDWNEFTTLLTSAANLLTSDDPLWAEGEVLHNIQQKLKRLLHCDKCLQLLQRVGQCLRNSVLLTLSQSYLDLAEHFIMALQTQPSLFMPSRQQLEYVLIRTQSAGMLLCEAIKYSKETFCRLVQRLQVGHIVQDLVMALSVTSRLNIMFRALLVQICDLYRNIYPWLKKLLEGEWKWPTDLDLPEDLETWLNMEDSEKINLSKEQVDFLSAVFKNNVEGESVRESIEYVSKDEESDGLVMDEVHEEDTSIPDYGEIIARDEIQEPHNELNEVIDAAQLQQVLFHKVVNAQNWKTLRSIWNNIDTISQNILPQMLTLKKMRIIDSLFYKLKENLDSKDLNNVSPAQKKKYTVSEVQKTGLKFLKHLGYTKKQIAQYQTRKRLTFNVNPAMLVPVKDWTLLKELYNNLQNLLKSCKQNKKCKKLEKAFRSRSADIKLLKQDKDEVTAKNMIFCTSKVLLAMCRKQIAVIEKMK